MHDSLRTDYHTTLLPTVRELSEGISPHTDLCLCIDVKPMEEHWVQLTSDTLNLSMVHGQLSHTEITGHLRDHGLECELIDHETDLYATFSINWAEEPDRVATALAHLLVDHFPRDQQLGLDLEITDLG